MQTTLLGLAIALILALVAALVGPLLIDWGGYRAAFEAEASHLVGLNVRVTGAIDARLLPSPQLTLHDIEIGPSGENQVFARSLNIEFALGPLMRGEWRAAELKLVGPEVRIGVDAAGRVQAPNLAVGFDPDALSIDRLSVQDGKLTLADAANGASITLDKLWFNGEARSLLGPVHGEGATTINGELYPFRLTAGRYGDDGKIKLHVNVDPVNQPLAIEADGFLASGGTPSFEGNLNLTRPVGIGLRGSGKVSQPWRAAGKIKVTPASALMRDFALDYGSQDNSIKLTGVAEFKFGKHPRFDGVLSARQIDLDRALAESETGLAPPAAAIRKLAQLAGSVFRPAIPIRIGVGVDQITLGGDTVQNFHGDVSTGAQGWNLDRFEFRAPGFTQVRLSGHLAVGDDRVAFTGPAEIRANNPKSLAAWLEGRGTAAKGDFKPMSLRGDLTLASDRIAVGRLNAEFDRKTVTGGFSYVFAAGSRPARLDAALRAPELDIDTALGFGKALVAGSRIERPRDMAIAADIGHATVAGFEARDLSAKVKVDGDGLQIDKLSVADLGGAAFSARGRIVTAPPSPAGSITIDLTAPDMTPVIALLSRFAPRTAEALGRGAQDMAPARLHAGLTVQGAKPAAQAELTVEGSLGKVRLAFNGQTSTDLTGFETGDLRFNGRLNADDGRALMSMLGLKHVVAVEDGPATLSFDASGPLRGQWRVAGKLNAHGLQASANGTASPLADRPAADLTAQVARADAAPLRGDIGGTLPVAFSGRIALAGEDVSLSGIEARVAGAELRGKLGVTLSAPHRLSGEIDANHMDGAALVAAAAGTPPPAQAKRGAWALSSEPFRAGAFGDYAGGVKLKVRRMDLLPQLTAREFSASLKLGNNEIALEDMSGDIAGGRLKGRLSLRAASDGLNADAMLALTGADATALFASGARPAVTGTLGLSGEVAGAGLSPVALIGSLRGAAKLELNGAQLAGLDPRAFDAVTRAVDQGLEVEPKHISDVVGQALQSGRLSVARAEATIALSSGQARLSRFNAESKDAQLSLTGNLDLTDGLLDAHVVLSGSHEKDAASRPDIFMALNGPVTNPERSMDVSALTGWLTLRAVENQARQLRELERARALERERELERERAAEKLLAPPPPAQKPATAPPGRSGMPKQAPAPLSRAPMQNTEAKAAPLQPALPPPRPAPVRARNPNRAPPLPSPVEIGRLPAPGNAATPETSAVNPQR